MFRLSTLRVVLDKRLYLVCTSKYKEKTRMFTLNQILTQFIYLFYYDSKTVFQEWADVVYWIKKSYLKKITVRTYYFV